MNQEPETKPPVPEIEFVDELPFPIENIEKLKEVLASDKYNYN